MGLFNGMKNKVEDMKFDFKYGNGLDKAKVVGKVAITGIEAATMLTNAPAGIKIASTANKLRKHNKGMKFVYTFTKNAHANKIAKIKTAYDKIKKANRVLKVVDIFDQLTIEQINTLNAYVDIIKEKDKRQIEEYGDMFIETTVEGRFKCNNYHMDLYRKNIVRDIQMKLKELDIEMDNDAIEELYDEFIKEENAIEIFWGLINNRIVEMIDKNVADRKIRKYIECGDCVHDCYAKYINADFGRDYILNEMILANIIDDNIEDDEHEEDVEIEEIGMFDYKATDFRRKMDI